MAGADPYEVAQALLTAFATAWTGKKLPDNRYVAEGESVAWDGDQVTVTVGPIRPGLPGQAAVTARPPRLFPVSAELTIQLIRKRGAGLENQGGRQTALPTATRNKRAGKASGEDLTAMLQALLKIRENGSVVSHATKIAVNGVRPVGPEGDLVGAEGTVVVLLGH